MLTYLSLPLSSIFQAAAELQLASPVLAHLPFGPKNHDVHKNHCSLFLC